MESLEQYLNQKYNPKTVANYLYYMTKYTDYYGEKAQKAQYNDILQYIEHLRKNTHLKPQSIKKYLNIIKIYYHYLIKTGIRKDHPCHKLYLKDQINKQIKVDLLYSSEILENYLENFKKQEKGSFKLRNQIIITLLIYQGLTNLEITNLKIIDVNLENASLTIKGNYNKKNRTLPLQARQILLLQNYLQNQRNQLINPKKQNLDYLILTKQGAQMHTSTIDKTINLHLEPNQKLSPKTIRQSVIANLLKKENDTRIVQVFAGHNRASTTAQYKQNALETLQNAIDKYHPLK